MKIRAICDPKYKQNAKLITISNRCKYHPYHARRRCPSTAPSVTGLRASLMATSPGCLADHEAGRCHSSDARCQDLHCGSPWLFHCPSCRPQYALIGWARTPATSNTLRAPFPQTGSVDPLQQHGDRASHAAIGSLDRARPWRTSSGICWPYSCPNHDRCSRDGACINLSHPGLVRHHRGCCHPSLCP